MSVDERDSDTSTLVFELQVHDRKHLARVIRAIRAHAGSAARHAHARVAHSRVAIASPISWYRRTLHAETALRSSHTDSAPKAIGTYSQAVRVGNTVYLSGQIPLDPATGELVQGDIEAQVRRVFENLQGRWPTRPAAASRRS